MHEAWKTTGELVEAETAWQTLVVVEGCLCSMAAVEGALEVRPSIGLVAGLWPLGSRLHPLRVGENMAQDRVDA